jgi:alpha-beta hydrolase superfamily lysophospholipase
VVWLIPLSVVVALWLNGRWRRAGWYDTPAIHPQTTSKCGSDMMADAFVSITGAFCGPPHLERLEAGWAEQGVVYRFRYPVDLFSMRKTVRELYGKIEYYDREHNHRHIFMMGYSLGGLIALLVWMHACRKNRRLANKLRLVVHDSPLGFEHLLIPGGMAVPSWLMPTWRWLGRNLWWLLRPGPVLNWIAKPFMRFAFPDLPTELQDEGANGDQIRRHREFLAGCRLSLMISKIAAIGAKRELLGDKEAPIVVVQCGKDEVVASNPAAEAWQALFPKAHFIPLGPNTRHISAPENATSFLDADQEAVAYLKKAYLAKK